MFLYAYRVDLIGMLSGSSMASVPFSFVKFALGSIDALVQSLVNGFLFFRQTLDKSRASFFSWHTVIAQKSLLFIRERGFKRFV